MYNPKTIQGKGIYLWHPQYWGTVDVCVDNLKKSHTDFVAVKISNGTYVYPGLEPYVNAIRAAGIRVGAWFYSYLSFPTAEAQAAARAVDLYRPDFLLEDGEAYAKGRYTQATQMTTRLRALVGTLPLALNSYWYPPYHPTFPFKQYRANADFDAPQVYWRGSLPLGKLSTSRAQYKAMSRKLPFALPAGDMYLEHGIKPTPGQVLDFLSYCNKDPEIKGVVMWSYDGRNKVPELWEAYSSYVWE